MVECHYLLTEDEELFCGWEYLARRDDDAPCIPGTVRGLQACQRAAEKPDSGEKKLIKCRWPDPPDRPDCFFRAQSYCDHIDASESGCPEQPDGWVGEDKTTYVCGKCGGYHKAGPCPGDCEGVDGRWWDKQCVRRLNEAVLCFIQDDGTPLTPWRNDVAGLCRNRRKGKDRRVRRQPLLATNPPDKPYHLNDRRKSTGRRESDGRRS